jgi:hypothetical protein
LNWRSMSLCVSSRDEALEQRLRHLVVVKAPKPNKYRKHFYESSTRTNPQRQCKRAKV